MAIINHEYHQYIASKEWRVKRAKRLVLDGHQCSRCPSTEALEVHHKTYDRLGSERMDDLITLCAACHKKDHGRDPSLPGAAPESFYTDRHWAREAMLVEQERIAEAMGIDLTAWENA